jgi:hypothetical protein
MVILSIQIVYILCIIVNWEVNFASSVVARPCSFNGVQPDTIRTPSLRLHGDVNHHYLVDQSGYVVVRDENDWFRYAQLNKSGLIKVSYFGGIILTSYLEWRYSLSKS